MLKNKIVNSVIFISERGIPHHHPPPMTLQEISCGSAELFVTTSRGPPSDELRTRYDYRIYVQDDVNMLHSLSASVDIASFTLGIG